MRSVVQGRFGFELGVGEGGGTGLSFAPVNNSDDVGSHTHGGLVGGADGGGAVGQHGLYPR